LDAGILAAPPSQWRQLLENQLTAAAEDLCGELAAVRREISQALSLPVCMTGSGSAMFVLCDDAAEAAATVAAVPDDLKPNCIIVQNNNW